MAIVRSYSEDSSPQADIQPVKSKLLDADASAADKQSECGNELRPTNFKNYIGQNKLQNILKIAISAAKKRGDISSLGHLLLYGPPGLGKTSCAQLLASELGTEAKVFSAPALERPKDIIGILMSLNAGDVLFIDEIHRLNKVSEELLYPAIEDFEVDLNSGQGSSSRIMRLNINKFIMVGATTKLGFISAPLRDRFTHIYRMEYYSDDELIEIINRNSALLDLKLDSAAARSIAERSRGTPRIVNRLLRLVRDFAQHHDATLADLDLSEKALDLYSVDRAGLDHMDKKILETLAFKYGGKPAGLESIASLIAEDKTTIEDYNEPFLIQKGFMIRTQRGRMITDTGKQYLENN